MAEPVFAPGAAGLTSTAPIEVTVVGLGPIGQEIVRVLARKDWARIVAGVDVDPDLQDRDVGEVAGLPAPLGIEVGGSLERDCHVAAHATVSDLERAADQVVPLLRRGISVVSTCEELSFPLDGATADRLDRAAREGEAGLLGTGINPGFLLDILPATLAVSCQQIEHVKASRIVDAGERRGPLQEKVGAGLALEEWRGLQEAGKIRHVGLPESARLLAAAAGWKGLEYGEESIEPVVAEEDVTTDVVRVRAGEAAGVRQVISAYRDDQEAIRLELAMYVGAQRPRDEVHIRGVPPVDMEIAGGVQGDRATAGVVANMLPRVTGARPGLLTMADLPVGAAL